MTIFKIKENPLVKSPYALRPIKKIEKSSKPREQKPEERQREKESDPRKENIFRDPNLGRHIDFKA